MKAVILAGGEATRLRPLTCNTPKVMVPVLNRPFFEHLIDYLKMHNILDIILAVGKLSEQVEHYFGDGSKFSVRLTYSTEDFPMGTAGAVKNAERFLDDSFIVFNGDIFTNIDLSTMIRLHRQNKAIASLALTPVDDPTIYGVVETDSQAMVKRFIEKPSRDKVTTNMINAGIYILGPDILSYITPNIFSMFERDVFPPLLDRGQAIYSYSSQDYWIDIGSPKKLREADRVLRENELEENISEEANVSEQASIGEKVKIEENVTVEDGATIKKYTVLCEGAHIGPNTVIEESTVGKDAQLENCHIQSSLLFEENIIDSFVDLEQVVIGEECDLKSGSVLKESFIGPRSYINMNNSIRGVKFVPDARTDLSEISK